MFAVSSECLACHNNLVAPTGEDVSIGASWRGSIMANSARDPYVLASVRREILDHPSLAAEIQDECAACHMPASQKAARAAGGHGRVFWQDGGEAAGPLKAMARDGVSCTVCHQISAERLGTSDSFNGNFVVASPLANGRRRAFGAFAPDRGRSRIMHSVTGFEQEQAAHIQQSELCATCHTLVTVARGPDGAIIGSLPEQMPYQEWRHSAFEAERRSCQSCHMPRGGWPRARRVCAGRRAAEPRAAHVSGRECVHAPAHESLSRRAWHGGYVAGARRHGASDSAAARRGNGQSQHRTGDHGRRHAGARRGRAQSDRS